MEKRISVPKVMGSCLTEYVTSRVCSLREDARSCECVVWRDRQFEQESPRERERGNSDEDSRVLCPITSHLLV